MTETHQTLGIHSGDAAEHHIRRRPMMRRAAIAVVIVLIVLGLGALRTVIARVAAHHSLNEQTTEQVRLYVNTIAPTQANGAHTADLPGTLQGAIESPIYARTSGYVVSWSRDIGAHVAKGELLATIATPEVDQQLAQAIAAEQQNASSLELAKSSYDRWQALRQKDAVSQQELDERQSAYTQAQANLKAAAANTRRLQELEGFKRIVAPFDGVVTRRNIDVGDLIDAGAGGTARPLFTMAKADPLRVYVYVPQTDAERIKVGDQVQVTQAELPGQIFKGTIARTAGAIDTSTRTLQVEISLPNPDGKLLPGAYVEVRVPTSSAPSLVVPVNALLFRAEGPRIAVIENGTARLHPVRIGRDYGERVEIVEGLAAQDQIIINPADSIVDGQPVTVVPQQASTPQPGAATGEKPADNAKSQGKSKDKGGADSGGSTSGGK